MVVGNYAKFGHGSAISFDATFGTNQSTVHLAVV
jgi:hypothetical protein